MKKTFLYLIATVVVTLQFCTAKKETAKTSATTTPAEVTTSFAKDIYPHMEASCTPCHFPEQGKKELLNDWESCKRHIDEIIERVELTQDDIKFMPFKQKKPAFTPEVIALFKKWKAEGMPK